MSINDSNHNEVKVLCSKCNQKMLIENPEDFDTLNCPICETLITRADLCTSRATQDIPTETKVNDSEGLNLEQNQKDSLTEKKPELTSNTPAVSTTAKRQAKSPKTKNRRRKKKPLNFTLHFFFLIFVCSVAYFAKREHYALVKLFSKEEPAEHKRYTKHLKEKKSVVAPDKSEKVIVQKIEVPKIKKIVVPNYLKPLHLIDDFPALEAELVNSKDIRALKSHLKNHCFECHGNEKHEEELNFEAFRTKEDFYANYNAFKESLSYIESKEMPPQRKSHLKPDQRQEFVALLKKLIYTIETNSRGKTGKSEIKRLNSHNYDNTIHALTGLDFPIAKRFQLDASNDISVVSMEKFIAAAEYLSKFSQFELKKGFFFDKDIHTPLSLKQYKQKLRAEIHELFPEFYFPEFERFEAIRRSMHALALSTYSADQDALKKSSKKQKINPLFSRRMATFLKTAINDPVGQHGLKKWRLLNLKTYDKTRTNEAIEEFIDYSKKIFEEKPGTGTIRAKLTGRFTKKLELMFELSKPEARQLLKAEDYERFVEAVNFEKLLKTNECDPQLQASLSLSSKSWLEAALRKPVSDSEVQKFVQRFCSLIHKDGLKIASQLMVFQTLIRLDFLFLFEEKNQTQPRLTEFEMANRLSYLMWNRPPDQEIIDFAASGQIYDKDLLTKKIQSMLRDTRSKSLIESFLNHWIGINALKDRAAENPLYQDMYDELIHFFDYVIRQDLDLTEIVSADYSFLNRTLAKHYELDQKASSSFKKIHFNTTKRGGLIGMAGIMALTSPNETTNPILRGNFILSKIIGKPTPDPPPDAGVLPAKEEVKGLSLVQVLEQHRENPSCNGCHAKIDPLGMPLEHYDHLGRWRDSLFNQGRLEDGRLLNEPKDLRKYIMKNESSYLKNLSSVFLSYALKRDLYYYDFYTVNKCLVNLEDNDNRFSALIATVILSHQFQHKL